MQKSVGIELEVEPDMPKVWIDREKMDHIIDNLLLQCLEVYREGSHSHTGEDCKKEVDY